MYFKSVCMQEKQNMYVLFLISHKHHNGFLVHIPWLNKATQGFCPHTDMTEQEYNNLNLFIRLT